MLRIYQIMIHEQTDQKENNNQVEALASLLTENGLDATDFVGLVKALGTIKQKEKEQEANKEEELKNSVVQDKEFLFNGTREDTYIYKDGRTKRGIYYIRIYEPKHRRYWSKSLKTSSKLVAMKLAEDIYMQRSGRINVGVRPTSITSRELVQKYQHERRKEITHIPHQGITQKSFNTMCNHIKYWELYVEEKGYKNTKLEDIPTDLGLRFGLWIKEKKRTKTSGGARCNYTINHTIAAVKKMYNDIGIKERYITAIEMPIWEYLKTQRDERPKRDIITEDEFTKISNYIKYKYCNEKDITEKEKIKRRIFGIVLTISHYTGMRPKEQLGLRWKDIKINQNDSQEDKKINRLIYIPSTNSKTGRSREIIAPIQPQLERLKKWYRQLGIEVNENGDQYIFPRLTLSTVKENVPTTKVAWTHRLKKVFHAADRDGAIILNGRVPTLYMFRHGYITNRLLRGVSMEDISVNCGTSYTYINSTYSHVTASLRSKEITKGLGKHRLKKEEIKA